MVGEEGREGGEEGFDDVGMDGSAGDGGVSRQGRFEEGGE